MAFDKIKDFEKLKKEVAIANKRIKALNDRYGEKSWATNQLYNKIDTDLVKGINKRGYIRINKNMDVGQLKAIEKATSEFKVSKTSKLTGVEETIRKVKKGLKATLGDYQGKGNETDVLPISNKDINKLYDLVEDRDKRDLTEQIGASTLWRVTKWAKDKDKDFSSYVKNVDKKGDIDIKDKEDLKFLRDLFADYTGKNVTDMEFNIILEKLKSNI